MQESDKLTNIFVVLALSRIAGRVGWQPKRRVAIRLKENSFGRNMVTVLNLVCLKGLTAQVAKMAYSERSEGDLMLNSGA